MPQFDFSKYSHLIKTFFNVNKASIYIFSLVLLCLFSFFLGIKVEFSYTWSKKIPGYGEYYYIVEQTQLVEDFQKKQLEAASEWKTFHTNESRLDEKKKALTYVDEAKILYDKIDLDALPLDWKAYTAYSYAYVNLICADFDGSIDCLNLMNDSLNTLTQLEKLKPESGWLNNWYRQKNVNLLRLQYAAILLSTDPNSSNNQALAKKALTNYGTIKKIKNENLQNDRLISIVYKLVYPREYRKPK